MSARRFTLSLKDIYITLSRASGERCLRHSRLSVGLMRGEAPLSRGPGDHGSRKQTRRRGACHWRACPDKEASAGERWFRLPASTLWTDLHSSGLSRETRARYSADQKYTLETLYIVCERHAEMDWEKKTVKDQDMMKYIMKYCYW